jgi:hypothetical protein
LIAERRSHHARAGNFPSSAIRLQKRAVLLAGRDRCGGLSDGAHGRHHGPWPETHPPNTDAGEIPDFGNTLRHHDVDGQGRELNELFDGREVGEPRHENSVSAGVGVSLRPSCRLIQSLIGRADFQQKRIGSRIDATEAEQLGTLLRELLARQDTSQMDRFTICRMCDDRLCANCPLPTTGANAIASWKAHMAT